jgi:hypothetical protein
VTAKRKPHLATKRPLVLTGSALEPIAHVRFDERSNEPG